MNLLLRRDLLIVPRQARYGFITFGLAALLAASPGARTVSRQDTVGGKDAQEKNAVNKPKDDDDKALLDFLGIYRLADGQDLKRIDPPRSSGAAVWWNRKFPAVNRGAGPEEYGAMVFRFSDPDHLTNWGGLFGRTQNGYPLWNIPQAIGMDVDPAEIEGDPKLLKTEIVGDWVFRDGVPAERMAQSLESILQRKLRMRLKLTFRSVPRDVVVVRGEYRPAPMPGRAQNELNVYGKELVKNAATRSMGDFPAFIKHVAGFIGRPVVSEVAVPPMEPITWFTHVRSPFTSRMHREDHDETLVLKHLHEQTGLTFTREMKSIRILFVERPK